MALGKSNSKERQRVSTAVWIIVTTIFAMSMFQVLGDALFGFGSPGGMVWLWIIGTITYFLPYITAKIRGRSNIGGILLVNLFFGWTIIGWCIAAQWSMSYDRGADRDAIQVAIEDHLRAMRQQEK